MNKFVCDQRENFITETNDNVLLAAKAAQGPRVKKNRAERDLIQNQPIQPP